MASTMKANVSSDDYYKILGVKKDASEKELTKAYRKAAMKWHPDRHQDEKAKAKAEATFKKIGEAYTVLKDPKTRETYDRFGKAGLQGGGGPPPSGAGGFQGGAPGGGYQMSKEQAEALFKDLFGGAGGAAGMGGSGGPGNMRFVFTQGGPGESGGHSFSSAGGNPFGGSAGGNSFGGAGGMGGGGAFDLSDLLGGMGGLGGGMQGGSFGGRRPSGTKRGNPFGDAAGAKCQRGASEGPIRNRTEVTIQGLKGQAQYNGKVGFVVDYDPASSRHIVRLADAGGSLKTLKIRPQNLVQRVKAKVHGLKAAEYNGKTAVVAGMNAAGDRYVCEVGLERKQMALKPENLQVDPETRVRIDGLKSQPQWNGRWAEIESYVPSSGRYRIQVLGASKKLDLKPANLRM